MSPHHRRPRLRPSPAVVLAAVVGMGAALLVACQPATPPTTTTTTTTTRPTTPTSTTTTTTTTTPSSGPVDVTHLPVGDGRYSTTPQVGYVNSCRTSYTGGGARAKGPWFNSDGTTWDATEKGTVDGDVSWPSALTTTVSGGVRSFTGNDLPDHTTGVFPISRNDDVWPYDGNPNSISSQVLSVRVPAQPTVAAQPSCLRGSVGILLTGAALFDALDDGGRDAVAWEAQDHCEGHPQATGMYHYHSLTTCLADPGTGHSNLLGYAYDGFGIYGLRGEDGHEVTNADLDECHGHTHAIEWDGQTVVMYHYHATREFPYTVGCFRGTPAQYQITG